MPSPFPGMNPYLEQDTVWHNFHEQFAPLCVECLVPQVRPHFIVKMDEHVYIHELSAEERILLGRADVAVSQKNQSNEPGAKIQLLEAPFQVRIPAAVDIERENFIKILDRDSRRVVTVIELLSPTNKKMGPDREQFLAKRRQLLASEIHYVEIDLLRGGPRMPIEEILDCAYYVLVSRYENRPLMGFWPLRIRDPLPVIPIPLPEPKMEAHLDLQAMLHRMYDAAGYEDYIYQGEPQPRLHPEDASWASQLIAMTKRA